MMKRFFFIALTLMIWSAGFAQIRKIPSAVTDAFKDRYPQAQSVEWKDKITVFQANFEMDGESYQAKFTNKGEWEQTERAMEQDDLPKAVKEGLEKSRFSDWIVGSVAWIEHKDNKIEYRIFVKKSTLEKKYLYFNKAGKLLRDSITL